MDGGLARHQSGDEIIIDRQGRIAAAHIGLVDREGIEAAIRQLLAE